MLRIGFVDELVPAGELATRVDALADLLAANAPLAVQGMKRALNAIAAGTADRAAIDAARKACAASDDIKEGGSEEHTSELQSLMRISYAVFCLKKKKIYQHKNTSPN